MEVRFVSTLTPEDEERVAPAVLASLAGLLAHTNLSYMLRIKTSGDRVFHHTHTASEPAELAAAPDAGEPVVEG